MNQPASKPKRGAARQITCDPEANTQLGHSRRQAAVDFGRSFSGIQVIAGLFGAILFLSAGAVGRCQAPEVSSVGPASPQAGGNLTIHGSLFGTAGVTVHIGSRQFDVPAGDQETNTQVTVAIPSNLYGVLGVQVENGNGKSNAVAVAISAPAVSNHVYGDHDERPLSFYMVAGWEQGYQSAQASAGNPFIALYGRRLFDLGDSPLDFGPYFSIRLIQAPQAGSTNNVISVLNDPTQTLTAQTLSQVGSAVDVTMGLDFHPSRLTTKRGRTTGEIILGGGFVSPTQANSQQAAFTMPNFGTGECAQMQAQNLGMAVKTINQRNNNSQYQWASSAASATNPPCLLNTLAVNASGGSTGVTTLIYATPDRPQFYGKYGVGFRIVNRYYRNSSSQNSCTTTTPCDRGMIDFTLGQNEMISGGGLNGLVFGAEGIHPIPVDKFTFIYVFGALFKQINGPTPQVFPPLILQPATIGGSNQPPNPATLVVPASLSARDFYRIGAGVSLNAILSALKKSGN